MAGKKGSGIYLGTTRRQRNRSMRSMLLLLSVLVVAAVLASFLLAYLIRNTESFPKIYDNSTDSRRMTEPADPERQTSARTEAVTEARTERPTPVTETPPVTDIPQETVVPVTGLAQKVLDYTDRWVVMLDPGHGFDDIGTSSALLGDTNEATVNLDLALRMKTALEEAGMTVLMTHDTNAVSGRVSAADGGEPPLRNLVLLPPEDRTALADGQDIDLFVSVHCDSLPEKPEVGGMRVYYHKNPDFPASRNLSCEALATNIANSFGIRMGGVTPVVRSLAAEDAYYVIRYTQVPCVLCEVGFVTNAADAASMRDPAWRQEAAEALTDGILAYIRGAE